MSRVLDGVIKDWGERLDYGRVKVVRVRNVRSGVSRADRPEPRPSEPATREKSLALSVRPAVRVKIRAADKDFSGRMGTLWKNRPFQQNRPKAAPQKPRANIKSELRRMGFCFDHEPIHNLALSVWPSGIVIHRA